MLNEKKMETSGGTRNISAEIFRRYLLSKIQKSVQVIVIII